jgi:hypothetical protein
MARSRTEHDLQAKTGLPGADAPVEIFEGEEIVFVQKADTFECSAVEHEDGARERRNGNNTLFVARILSVAKKSHAAPT